MNSGRCIDRDKKIVKARKKKITSEKRKFLPIS